jgi:hypothetical protein
MMLGGGNSSGNLYVGNLNSKETYFQLSQVIQPRPNDDPANRIILSIRWMIGYDYQLLLLYSDSSLQLGYL